jgi:hypothetical protein
MRSLCAETYRKRKHWLKHYTFLTICMSLIICMAKLHGFVHQYMYLWPMTQREEDDANAHSVITGDAVFDCGTCPTVCRAASITPLVCTEQFAGARGEVYATDTRNGSGVRIPVECFRSRTDSSSAGILGSSVTNNVRPNVHDTKLEWSDGGANSFSTAS